MRASGQTGTRGPPIRRLAWCLPALFLLLAGPVAAQGGLPRPLVPPKAEGSLELRADRHGGRIVVPVNLSQVVEVDRTFSEVTVGNPEIADLVPLTRRSVYVFGKAIGTTSLTFTDQQGAVIAAVDLVVTYDIDGLKAQLHELLPEETIEVRPAADGIVLSGQVSSAARLAEVLAIAQRYAPEKVTSLLEVTGNQQVMLAVRFAEVARDVAKGLGFTNDLLFQSGDTTLRLATGDGPQVDPAAFAAGALSVVTGDIALNAVLDTLEEKGVVKTLAEPNLIALSGDTANFLAGGEFPIPVGREAKDGFVEITIAFKEFGVSLSFTPTVVTEDLINLQLFTEVSEIDPTSSIRLQDLVIPGLKVRRAKTTVELKSGQSFAIAGLLQQDFEDAVRQFPILGDLPVLSALFRSTRYLKGETELVVVVTPHLVKPSSPTALLTPADTFVPPSDAELFLFGRTEGSVAPYDPADSAMKLGRKEAAGIVGPYGYILK